MRNYLEALLGSKGDGLAERLARRIASILGENEADRENLREEFKGLYDFRCDVVHGNQAKKQVYEAHLRRARDFARQTALWFLSFLNHVQERAISSKNVKNCPSRKNLLALIDRDMERTNHLEWLRESLAKGFPYVQLWME